LLVTAAVQLVIVALSGSVALLADTLHNFGDAATALPLWVAFALARQQPSERFTYGLGRFEDFAGMVIVLIMALSALIAGYEAVTRLIHSEPVTHLGAVVVASVLGFLGNEAIALFRITVGRDIGSAALIADGYHARVDGWTSLAVFGGAVGVWLGYPLADPLVGLLITAAILWLVWQSGKMVFTRARWCGPRSDPRTSACGNACPRSAGAHRRAGSLDRSLPPGRSKYCRCPRAVSG